MNIAQATHILSQPLRFGDGKQLQAARVLELYQQARSGIRQLLEQSQDALLLALRDEFESALIETKLLADSVLLLQCFLRCLPKLQADASQLLPTEAAVNRIIDQLTDQLNKEISQ